MCMIAVVLFSELNHNCATADRTVQKITEIFGIWKGIFITQSHSSFISSYPRIRNTSHPRWLACSWLNNTKVTNAFMLKYDSLMFARSSLVLFLPCSKHVWLRWFVCRYMRVCVCVYERLPVLCSSSVTLNKPLHNSDWMFKITNNHISTIHLNTTPPSIPISFKSKTFFFLYRATLYNTSDVWANLTSTRSDKQPSYSLQEQVLCCL